MKFISLSSAIDRNALSFSAGLAEGFSYDKELIMITDETLASLGNRSSGTLEENLSAFAQRFPVSGRVVEALARQTGGVLGVAARLKAADLWDTTQSWISSGKSLSLDSGEFRRAFDRPTIEAVARTLGISADSVEIQAALGIPKFFTTLAHAEDEDLGLGLGTFGIADLKNRSVAMAKLGARSESRVAL